MAEQLCNRVFSGGIEYSAGMDARILRLRLSRPLRYLRGAVDVDVIQVYPLDRTMAKDDEGPHARSPLPSPVFTGGLEVSAADQPTPADPGGTRASNDGTSFTIGTDPCAIAQFDGNVEPESCLDVYLRDAWWAGIELLGPLILRKLREDGREVFQWISPATFPSSR